MDYVQEPKESGYRSIHFIYKYKSENKDVDGAKVELQVRTKLQHSWAMAVETAGLITSTPLKSSMGSEEWLDFFKIEKGIIDKINAVVLVSVPKMKELQEAYPSYFLNTTEFLQAIDTMMENCEKINIVSQ